jgi:hypothetical protein
VLSAAGVVIEKITLSLLATLKDCQRIRVMELETSTVELVPNEIVTGAPNVTVGPTGAASTASGMTNNKQ